MGKGLVVQYEETKQIAELPIRDTLYIEEELDITSLGLWYRSNVDLAGSDSERLYFKIEVRGLGHTLPPPSPWPE
jgi:hypothetical protein